MPQAKVCVLRRGIWLAFLVSVCCSARRFPLFLSLCSLFCRSFAFGASARRRGHANLLCIVPISSDDPRGELTLTSRPTLAALLSSPPPPPPPPPPDRLFAELLSFG